MIGLLLVLIFFFSLFMLMVSMSNIGRIKLAQQTLDNIQHMYHNKIITKTQAMVFMREMNDPLDTRAIIDVNRQLKEIYEEHKNTN